MDFSNLHHAGWRQGAVLPKELHSALIPCFRDSAQVSGDGIAIVLSQDCDVNCPSLAAEPFVEILWAMPVHAVDGNLSQGKNPRRLHFRAVRNKLLQVYETHVRWRCELSRERLFDNLPDAHIRLENGVVALLSKWIAKRYTRAAFPDSFNKRYRPSQKKIRAILKKSEFLFSGIYILMEEDEKPESDPYRIVLRATMPDSEYANTNHRADAEQCIAELAQILESSPGIQVEEHDIVAEDDFSLTDVAYFKRWDFDDLSVADTG